MKLTSDDVKIIEYIITAIIGLVGIGIGIGFFKSILSDIYKIVKSHEREIEHVKERQARLRGEDNGGTPIFITTTMCDMLRKQCRTATDRQNIKTNDQLKSHGEALAALQNFARYWMQKEGLKIEEINQILGGFR